jgi:hypothetical protein
MGFVDAPGMTYKSQSAGDLNGEPGVTLRLGESNWKIYRNPDITTLHPSPAARTTVVFDGAFCAGNRELQLTTRISRNFMNARTLRAPVGCINGGLKLLNSGSGRIALVVGRAAGVTGL